jgi:hypothetical protein
VVISYINLRENECLSIPGLLAWIVEKFRTWSDCNGDVESVFSKDELLTNISIYWFSANITSTFRIYYEAQHTDLKSKAKPFTAYCKVPLAWEYSLNHESHSQ